MKKREKWLRSLVCMAVLTTFPMMMGTAEASEEPTAANDKVIQAPVTVDSRDLTYNNLSGDFVASGDVSITQGTMTIKADEIYGNSKTSIVSTDGNMRIIDPTAQTDLIGTTVHYNYKDKTGTMVKAKGQVQGDYIQGEDINIASDKTTFKNGSSTKCPAKHPDWRLEAKEVELFPDGYVLAHDATFYLKDKAVYHTDRYEKEPDEDHSFIPHPGYNSSDGFYIKQDLKLPLFVDGLNAFLNWGYYSRHDFRALGGLQYHWNGQMLRIVTGDVEDSDDEWINKKIEYQWKMFDRRIGNSKFHYRLEASHGLWEDSRRQSWHDEYEAYISHDPINITSKLTLDLGAGYQVIKESYDDSTKNGMIYDAKLTQTFSPKFKVWTGYHYIHDNERLFDYDRPDLEREWRSGFRYSWNEKDAVGFIIRYNVDTDELFERIYFFEKDLHCWKMRVIHEPDDGDGISIKFSTKIW
ncbi:MAG: LPS-assembly protein LptD [Selenomonadales bacterium]|nr:LPS-assembly protein LptD [Selenomonadales bacterium]MBQ5587451.1 LPS-assembly protein LptD [Selenomonadales bacterium]MBQ5745381.1 LPS-assembly protein LptD [Selenomonadales bacterium]